MNMRTVFFGCVAAATVLIAACSDPEAAKRRSFESGNQFFEQKKYAAAIVEYRNALKQDAKFGEARVKLAEAYAYTGNARAAYSEQIRAADLLPQNTEVQLRAVGYLLAAGQFEDAKTRVQKVLDRDPKNVQALILRGSALAALKDLAGAIAEIEQAIELDPSRSGTYTNLATLKLAQGDRDQARAAFEKAVELDPKSVSARVVFASFQWGINDGAGAEQSLKAALAIDAKHVLANRALATYYMGSGRAPEAEPYLKTLADVEGDGAKVGLADYYIALRRFNEAKRVLDSLLANGTNGTGSFSTPAELRLAQIAYAEKHTSDAHAALDKVLTRDPRNLSALLVKARWLAGEGKTQDALLRATAAVTAAPQSAPAHYLLGTLQASVRDLDGATKSFNEVLRLNPRAADAQIQLSRLTLARGDTASAVQFAQAAVKNAPGNPIPRLSLARGLVAERQTVRAETELASLLKDYPNAAPVHALNGTLKATRNDLPGARIEYQRALQIDPSSIEALSGLTMLDVAEKNTAGARVRVEAHLAAQPDRPELLALAARVYIADKNSAKAEQALRHLIDVQPTRSEGYSMLGQIYLAQGKLDAARAEFERRMRLNPKDAGARTMVGMIFEMQKNLPEAAKQYNEVLSIDARSAVAANNLAYIYADAGENLDRALSLAQTAVEQIPDSPSVQDTLGWVYYKKGLPDLAARAFEVSIAKDPANPIYQYHLGLAYTKAGDIGRARRALEAALKLKPDYADAQRALKLVAG